MLTAVLAVALAGGMSSVVLLAGLHSLKDAAISFAVQHYHPRLEHAVSRVLADISDDGRIGALTRRELSGFVKTYQDLEVPFGSYQDAVSLQARVAAAERGAMDADSRSRIEKLCLTTLCYAAVRRGDARRVEALIQQGAQAESRESWSRMYVDYHPGMHMNIEPYSMLQEAAGRGFTDVARLLIDAGADLEASQTVSSRTALHLAAANGYKDIVRLLIDAGADVNATSQIDQTPLDEALAAGHQDVAAILTSAMARVQSGP